MSPFDNEIYRGPPEAGPTLEHDLRSYGSDVYIVKSEVNTLAQDVPATEEPARQESAPVKKKESRLAKAMKLLASCTAAVTIAATLGVAAPVQPQQPPVQNTLDEWPWFHQASNTYYGFAFSPYSRHGSACQASVNGSSFRFEVLQEGMNVVWFENSYYNRDGSSTSIQLDLEHAIEDWEIALDVFTAPCLTEEDPHEARGTIQTENGEELYVIARAYNSDRVTDEQLQSIVDNLSSYIRVTEPTDDGWGKVLIGGTLISDTSPGWTGRSTTDYRGLSIGRIHYASLHGFDTSQAMVQREMNGILWSFFFTAEGSYEVTIWAVPSHEDLALGIRCGSIMEEFGFSYEMLAEDPNYQVEFISYMADVILDQCLSHYYLSGEDYREELPLPESVPEETTPWDTLPPETFPPEPTEPEETEPTLPEPYPEMEEFIQYTPSNSWQIVSTRYARSGRACQFVTQWDAYRLRASEPELFVHWEEYYYDVKEDMVNSRVRFSHYEEDWSISAWVFEEEVESMYQGFPLAMENGKTLWFYADPNYSNVAEEDMPAIFQRISELVTLSDAREDGWGKVRIGDTMISHNSASWNGLACTSGGYDYWGFEQLLTSADLESYTLRPAGSHTVNGITWNFFTYGEGAGYVYEDGSRYYYTRVFAIPEQEDIVLATALSYGLSPDESQFTSREAYEAHLDTIIDSKIDTIVRDGLSNIYLYP